MWINEIKHGEYLAQSLARGERGRAQPGELRKAKQAENLAFCKHRRHLTSLALIAKGLCMRAMTLIQEDLVEALGMSLWQPSWTQRHGNNSSEFGYGGI